MSSGSDKRQRTKRHTDRYTTDEFNRIAAKADRAGLSFSAFVRASLLGDAGPRARRRPVIEKELLIRALGLHGRYGNNMNQIARTGNAGNPVDLPALRQAIKEWGEIRDALYRALGKDTSSVP
jgi:hypothetical protein